MPDPDGSGVYVSHWIEDYWYSCDSSFPELQYIDFATGERETIGSGDFARPSPDGTRLAYLAASKCIPDPSNPANWVVAVLDTVVVRDLATGDELRYTDPTILENFAATGGDGGLQDEGLSGLVWTGGNHLIAGDQRLLVGPTLAVVNRTNRSIGSEGRVVGYDPNREMVLIERSNGDTAELVGFDEVWLDEIGVQATVPAGEERPNGLFALDPSGSQVAAIDNGVLAVGEPPSDLVEFPSFQGLDEVAW